VLSQDEVAQQLAEETASPATPPLSLATVFSQPRTLSSRAGQLVVGCGGPAPDREESGELAYLLSWSPNPGYRDDD
jgi:hypothetical protein